MDIFKQAIDMINKKDVVLDCFEMKYICLDMTTGEVLDTNKPSNGTEFCFELDEFNNKKKIIKEIKLVENEVNRLISIADNELLDRWYGETYVRWHELDTIFEYIQFSPYLLFDQLIPILNNITLTVEEYIHNKKYLMLSGIFVHNNILPKNRELFVLGNLFSKAISMGNLDYVKNNINELKEYFEYNYKTYGYDLSKMTDSYSPELIESLSIFELEDITDQNKEALSEIFEYSYFSIKNLNYGSYKRIQAENILDDFSMIYLMATNEDYNGSDFSEDLLKMIHSKK